MSGLVVGLLFGMALCVSARGAFGSEVVQVRFPDGTRDFPGSNGKAAWHLRHLTNLLDSIGDSDLP